MSEKVSSQTNVSPSEIFRIIVVERAEGVVAILHEDPHDILKSDGNTIYIAPENDLSDGDIRKIVTRDLPQVSIDLQQIPIVREDFVNSILFYGDSDAEYGGSNDTTKPGIPSEDNPPPPLPDALKGDPPAGPMSETPN